MTSPNGAPVVTLRARKRIARLVRRRRPFYLDLGGPTNIFVSRSGALDIVNFSGRAAHIKNIAPWLKEDRP